MYKRNRLMVVISALFLSTTVVTHASHEAWKELKTSWRTTNQEGAKPLEFADYMPEIQRLSYALRFLKDHIDPSKEGQNNGGNMVISRSDLLAHCQQIYKNRSAQSMDGVTYHAILDTADEFYATLSLGSDLDAVLLMCGLSRLEFIETLVTNWTYVDASKNYLNELMDWFVSDKFQPQNESLAVKRNFFKHIKDDKSFLPYRFDVIKFFVDLILRDPKGAHNLFQDFLPDQMDLTFKAIDFARKNNVSGEMQVLNVIAFPICIDPEQTQLIKKNHIYYDAALKKVTAIMKIKAKKDRMFHQVGLARSIQEHSSHLYKGLIEKLVLSPEQNRLLKQIPAESRQSFEDLYRHLIFLQQTYNQISFDMIEKFQKVFAPKKHAIAPKERVVKRRRQVEPLTVALLNEKGEDFHFFHKIMQETYEIPQSFQDTSTWLNATEKFMMNPQEAFVAFGSSVIEGLKGALSQTLTVVLAPQQEQRSKELPDSPVLEIPLLDVFGHIDLTREEGYKTPKSNPARQKRTQASEITHEYWLNNDGKAILDAILAGNILMPQTIAEHTQWDQQISQRMKISDDVLRLQSIKEYFFSDVYKWFEGYFCHHNAVINDHTAVLSKFMADKSPAISNLTRELFEKRYTNNNRKLFDDIVSGNVTFKEPYGDEIKEFLTFTRSMNNSGEEIKQLVFENFANILMPRILRGEFF